MKFSVLQSVYHRDNPSFLSQSLKSIAENTLMPEQVVLVKDGTLTPKLEAVISEWESKLPLKVVGYEKNHGLAHALNYGLQFLATELVARMDSDDICFPDRFEKQVLQFEKNNNLVILGTGIEEFYKNDEINFHQIRLYPKLTTKKSIALYKGTPLAHPTVMLRTEILKKFKYSEETKCNEDIELWFRLLGAGYEIQTIQAPLLHFRITDGTFKRRSLSKALNEYFIYFHNLLKFNGISKNHFYLLMRLFTRFLPSKLIKKLYFSSMRKNMFKESL